MPDQEQVLLGIQVDANFERAQKAAQQFEKQYKRAFDSVKNAVKKSQKTQLRATSEFATRYMGNIKLVKGMKKEQKQAEQSIVALTTSLKKLGAQRRAAKSDDEKKAIDARIKEQVELRKTMQLTARGAKAKIAEVREEFDFSDMVDSAKKAGAELTEPLSRFMSKDLPGAFEASAKIAGAAFNGIVGGTGGLVSKLGKAVSKGGDRLWKSAGAGMQKGGVGGVAKGVGAGALGGIAKVLGPILKTIGPVLQIVGKLGPLLGILSSSLVGLVKMMVDAESAAKEFNKSVLQSTSITGFLDMTLDSAGTGAEKLSQELATLRDSAMNLDNALAWGINKEQFLGVINTITQEGVALKDLGSYYQAAREDALAYAKDHKTMVQMVVAYSRLIGVSTQEITSLQGEMMSEMGMGLASVQESFYHITRASEESGIASNKFFNMIRGVSADLSLFNFRMEDAAKLLGKLGQVMSPRNASKFMQTAMNALKGMGRMQKIQVAMLAGPGKVSKIVQKDLAQKEKRFAEDLAETVGKRGDQGAVDAFAEAIRGKDRKAIEAAIAQAAPEQQGALREQASQINLQRTRSKKGMVGTALAAGNTSPIAQMEILSAAVSRFGKKNISEAVGDLGTEMLSENLGVSQEQLDQMAMFNDMLESQRQALIDSTTDENEKAKIAHADNQDLWEMLDKDTKENMLASTKQIDYAKKTSDLQVSALDKMDMLIDVLMNMIYNVMTKVYNVLSEMYPDLLEAIAYLVPPGLGKGALREKASQARKKGVADKEIYATRDAEVIKAYEGAGGDLEKMKGELMKTMGPKMAAVEKADAERARGLDAAYKQAEEKGDTSEMSRIQEERKQLGSRQLRRRYAVKDAVGKEGVLQATGVVGEKKGKTGDISREVQRLIRTGAAIDIDTALEYVKASGLASQEQMDEFLSAFMGQVGWNMGGVDLAKQSILLKGQQGAAEKQAAAAAQTKEKAEETAAIKDAKERAAQAAENLPEAARGGVPVAAPTPAAPTPAAPTPAAPTPAAPTPAAPTPEVAGMVGDLVGPVPQTDKDAAAAFGISEETLAEMQNYGALGQQILDTSIAAIEGGDVVQGTLAGIEETLKIKGIKINKSFLDNQIGKVIADSTLKSLRTALLEQALFMLATTDPDKLRSWTKEDMGTSAADILASGTNWVKENVPNFKNMQLGNNATGGLVAGIAGGMAQVSPAPGEGLASVGVGETIVPRGGGGGGQRVEVSIRLDGDLTKKLIKAQASNAIVEHAAAAPRR